MRCLALAQAWQEHGGRAVFLSVVDSPAQRARIERAGVDWCPLADAYPSPADLATIRQQTAAWTVVDGYHFDTAYYAALRAAGHQVCAVDDLAALPYYPVHTVLNQNPGAEQFAYVVPPGTRLLLGERYALLRPEFLARLDAPPAIRPIASRVLVTFGGADPENVTIRAVQALRGVASPALEVRVVVGPTNPHLAALQAATANWRLCKLLVGVEDMAACMAWADLAVAAAGSTALELAALGVPTILLVLAANQAPGAAALAAAGAALDLGPQEAVSVDDLRAAVEGLLPDAPRRAALSERARRLVDGRGASRVVAALQETA